MGFLKKNKTIIIVIVIIVLAFAVYSFYFKGEEELLIVPESGTAIGGELVPLLLELRSLQFDETIFEDEVFNRLEDFSQELIPEPKGRRNPFAPIGVGDSQF